MSQLFVENDARRVFQLTEADVGAWVVYFNGDYFEKGRVKSFNNERGVAWVVYHCDNNWNTGGWVNYTAACTKYSDLYYAE